MEFLTDKEVGERVAELRTAAGETQTQLGELLGIGQSGVSKVERGERALSARELAILSDHFGVTNNALVTRDESLALLRAGDAAPQQVKDAVALFHQYVDFHFGVEALAG